MQTTVSSLLFILFHVKNIQVNIFVVHFPFNTKNYMKTFIQAIKFSLHLTINKNFLTTKK